MGLRIAAEAHTQKPGASNSRSTTLARVGQWICVIA